jgi:hypothetical protein
VKKCCDFHKLNEKQNKTSSLEVVGLVEYMSILEKNMIQRGLGDTKNSPTLDEQERLLEG